VQEIAPGLWHWRVPHPQIRMEVSSYYLANERVLLDPMMPPAGTAWFREHGEPRDVILTNRHHDRDAWLLRDEFGCTIHCVREGLHELSGRGDVSPFEFGDALPGAIVAYEVGALCPDEAALHIPAHAALACADGVVRWGSPAADLSFVPDWLMDEPTVTKHGLREAYRALLDVDFDLLLLAHGDPVVGGGHAALTAFVDRA
jgi:hypothetical protein